MNTRLVSLLGTVCVVCALIITGEWFYAVYAQKHALTSTTTAESKKLHDEMPDVDLTSQTEDSYADLVAKPLFVKGRRPVDEPSPEETQTTNVAKTFDWQLNGVYSTKKGLSALFSRSKSRVPKDNYRKIRTGVDLDGWKLTEIHKDRAILKQGDQQKELLLRKPKLKELPKSSNVPNMPNNSPQPEEIPQPIGIQPEEIPQPIGIEPEEIPEPEDIPQPAEGEFENNNEQF